MSYDIYLINPITKETIDTGKPTQIYGNTYCRKNSELWINLTYNYRYLFEEALGEDGIRILQDKISKDTWDILLEGIKYCNKEGTRTMSTYKPPEDPWKPNYYATEVALKKLLNMALQAPDAIWEIS